MEEALTPRTYSYSNDFELADRSTTSPSDSSTSGNLTLSLDPILSTSSSSLTPFEEGDFILEEIEACLTNDSIPPGINDDNFDPEGDLPGISMGLPWAFYALARLA
ncbi:hypothetical protein Tco_1159325 [Tanacetum coccineum]